MLTLRSMTSTDPDLMQLQFLCLCYLVFLYQINIVNIDQGCSAVISIMIINTVVSIMINTDQSCSLLTLFNNGDRNINDH